MISLFKDLQKLNPIFSVRDKWKFAGILGLMFFASVLEAVGIGAIPLFVAMLMKPSTLSGNQWVGQWFENLPDEPSVQIMLLASLALITFLLLKTI